MASDMSTGPSSSGHLFSNGEQQVGFNTTCILNPCFCVCRCLVAAGIKDINRPAENISIPQNIGKCGRVADDSGLYGLKYVLLCAALTATGLIWVRYSFVITPVNYSLAAVNAFVGATGGYQLFRALKCVWVSLSLPFTPIHTNPRLYRIIDGDRSIQNKQLLVMQRQRQRHLSQRNQFKNSVHRRRDVAAKDVV